LVAVTFPVTSTSCERSYQNEKYFPEIPRPVKD